MGRSTQKVTEPKSVLVLLTGVFFLAGCGTTREPPRGDRLKEYEATFRPSEYDLPLDDMLPEGHRTASKDSAEAAAVPDQPPELTQGYRVQIFATSSYDEATETKATAEAQFPDEWFYIVYDPPTYKVRAGNFIERYEADRFARRLSEEGYRDSWVVPEKVYSSPPPRPPQVPEGQIPPK